MPGKPGNEANSSYVFLILYSTEIMGRVLLLIAGAGRGGPMSGLRKHANSGGLSRA